MKRTTVLLALVIVSLSLVSCNEDDGLRIDSPIIGTWTMVVLDYDFGSTYHMDEGLVTWEFHSKDLVIEEENSQEATSTIFPGVYPYSVNNDKLIINVLLGSGNEYEYEYEYKFLDDTLKIYQPWVDGYQMYFLREG